MNKSCVAEKTFFISYMVLIIKPYILLAGAF